MEKRDPVQDESSVGTEQLINVEPTSATSDTAETSGNKAQTPERRSSEEPSSSSDCESCRNLEKQASELRQEIEELKKKLEKTEKQLKKAEFERESSRKYVESFREQVSQLHKKLDSEKKQNTSLEEQLKQMIDAKDDASTKENDEKGMDIASSIKEAAKDFTTAIKEAAKDIASTIREAAQQATTSNGFAYDEKTGLYYDYNTGYYYDPSTRLYYEWQKGIYYTYNSDTGSYDFYSQVAASASEPADVAKEHEGKTGDTDGTGRGRKVDKEKAAKIEEVESGSEDGEIIEISDDEDEEEKTKKDDKSDEEEDFAPCIRVIVMHSDKISIGSLHIVTCMGITLGRVEGVGNFLRLSDVEVSKEHARIHYDKESHQYYVTDLGSQNGTFVNGTRLSETKVPSEPRQLTHGEQLTLGGTTFLLHIHPGNETCDDCEPGQIQAQIKAKEKEDEVQILGAVTSNTNTNAQRKKELRRLKKRYMLQNSDHEVNSEIASNTAGKYKDRANVRRKKVGSDTPRKEIDEAPASVYKPIKSENKGRLMLEKMGWTAGEGLGKTKSGRTEPVIATVLEGGRGLGYAGVKSVGGIPPNSKSMIWRKAHERYNAPNARTSPAKTPSTEKAGTRKNEPIDIFADTDT